MRGSSLALVGVKRCRRRDPRCEDPPSPSSVSNVAVVVNVVVLVFVIVLVIIQFRDLYLPSFADSYFRHVHTKP
jgi:hypothetical protein